MEIGGIMDVEGFDKEKRPQWEYRLILWDILIIGFEGPSIELRTLSDESFTRLFPRDSRTTFTIHTIAVPVLNGLQLDRGCKTRRLKERLNTTDRGAGQNYEVAENKKAAILSDITHD